MIRPLLPRFRRLFSTETLQSPPTIQRGFSFGRVLFGSIILSTASVAGAVVFSAENPEFHSLLVTNIPEPAMEWLVKGQKQYIQLKSSVSGSRNNQGSINRIHNVHIHN
jgi:hypothetical protein